MRELCIIELNNFIILVSGSDGNHQFGIINRGVNMSGYQTVADVGISEFIEKKSKFLGFCFPIATEQDAQIIISEYEKKYRDATHVVYAYQVGAQDEKMRSTDDGEPAGTAGRPILELLKQGSFHDTLVIVVRYFGGTLLGTGGLVRAYSRSAAMAIENAGKAEVINGIEVLLSVPYDCFDKLEKRLQQCDCLKVNISYTDVVSLQIKCEKENWFSLQKDILSWGQESVHILILEEDVPMKKRK